VQEPPAYVPAKGFDRLSVERELGIVERIFLLRRTRVFKNANVNSTARFARQMKEVRLPASEVVWRPGDRAYGSLFIVQGQLELRWNQGSTVQVVGPGYMVGGAESLALMQRWNELVTTEPVVGLRASR